MSRPSHQLSHRAAFTLFEVVIALAVFAFAVVGLMTALNTAIQSALEVRQRAMIRQELDSQLAIRMGIPLAQEKFVLEAKENHGIRVEETSIPYPLKNKDGVDLVNITKLTITASIDKQSDSASILVSK
jgi:type II secretory pathway pseudopilin PulG